MAPMISGTKKNNKSIKSFNNKLKIEKNNLSQIRKFVENNFEYVGKNFIKEVREIYYNKKNKKAIYGTTTSEEKKELEDEGIDLLSIPWISKDN